MIEKRRVEESKREGWRERMNSVVEKRNGKERKGKERKGKELRGEERRGEVVSSLVEYNWIWGEDG